ncbi:MAG: hypothetical protein KGZ69_15415 [Methylomonas sp.]|nr:hypothetical protein [Methylomonas sp.]
MSAHPSRLTLKSNASPSAHSRYISTVECNCCQRFMVPRVISYYGRFLRSVCPFCGATFMKFPSGIQRFLQRCSDDVLSFDVFLRLVFIATFFGITWFAALSGALPDPIISIAAFGTVLIGTLALAELSYQCVEQLAVKLNHESNYYWAALVLAAVIIANARHDLIFFIIILFLAMSIRGIFAGLAQASKK